MMKNSPATINKNMKPDYQYLVKIYDINNHYFEVNLKLISDEEEIILLLPAWTPGSYMIRDYSTHLHQFSATDEQTMSPVPWEQIDLHKWKVKSGGKAFNVRYIIYAFEDFTVRTNYLDPEFGFINPAALFLYVENCLNSRVSVSFEIQPHFSNVYTALHRLEGNHQFIADDFDELYDSPFHLSNKNSVFFETDNCKHELIIEGQVSFSFKEKLSADLKLITSTQIRWMGVCPNSYYLFVLNLSQTAYGGLEHRSSSINFFNPEQIYEEEEYTRLLELMSHEYFHLWNVKRIRPIALGPFDYQKPNLTNELWIAEGVTSFYDIYFLYQAGFLKKEDFLKRIQSDILVLEETGADEWMSLEESSFTAWNKYYKRNGNSHNITVSYYTKGAILILCMIIFILKETNGEKSFRDIMQALYRIYYLEKKRGFTKREFFDTAKEATRVDLKLEFDQYLTEPKKIPVEEYLKWIGIFRSETDWVADFGFKVKEKNGNLYVSQIFQKKNVRHIDIQLEDEILAINRRRVTMAYFQTLTKQLKPKESVHILLARFNQTKEVIIEMDGVFKNKKLSFFPEAPPEIQSLQNLFFLRE